ncbi:unnamed protein product [Orchesella dallaii]|uniref:Uncharacterized protein n=1 Tax=Orchesella dallaii TaxID=48710 RepID=A0ABP1RW75_9HEXA
MIGYKKIFIIFAIFTQLSNGNYFYRQQACAVLCGGGIGTPLSRVELSPSARKDLEGRVGEVGSISGIKIGPIIYGSFRGQAGINVSESHTDRVHDGYQHVQVAPDGSTYTTFKDLKIRDRDGHNFFGEINAEAQFAVNLGTFIFRK